MDQEKNTAPSSESSEAEPISNNMEEINEPIMTNTENDCRINCTDSQSLHNIQDISLHLVEGLADALNLKDSRKDFVSVFGETIQCQIQEEEKLAMKLAKEIHKKQKLS